jgi:hypothetical protein
MMLPPLVIVMPAIAAVKNTPNMFHDNEQS